MQHYEIHSFGILLQEWDRNSETLGHRGRVGERERLRERRGKKMPSTIKMHHARHSCRETLNELRPRESENFPCVRTNRQAIVHIVPAHKSALHRSHFETFSTYEYLLTSCVQCVAAPMQSDRATHYRSTIRNKSSHRLCFLNHNFTLSFFLRLSL